MDGVDSGSDLELELLSGVSGELLPVERCTVDCVVFLAHVDLIL